MRVKKNVVSAGSVTGELGLFDGTNRAYSDSNPPESLERTLTSTPATPRTGVSVEWTPDGKSLMMRAPDGTTTRIGPATGAYPWTEQVLTADYTNTLTTASDVHAGFTPVASTRYLLEATLIVISAATTTGVQIGVTSPTGFSRSAVKVVSAATASTDLISHQAANTFQAGLAGLTTPTILNVQAFIAFTATPGSGTVRLQARTEVALSQITVCAGSSVRWRTV